MLLELEKAKPDEICVEKMITIPRSEYSSLKTGVDRLTQEQGKQIAIGARKWLTEKSLALIEAGLELKPDSSEQSVLIELDGIKTNKSLHEKFVVMRKENIELKKRLAEQTPPTLDDLIDKGEV
jgi:hypothetical protein